MMSLTDLLRLYQSVRLVGASEAASRIHTLALRLYERFLGRPATLADLNDVSVGEFLNWLLGVRKLRRPTVSMYRARLLALWRFAHRRRLLDAWPEVAPIKSPRKIPVALTVDQLRALWRATEGLPGVIGGIPAGPWMRCFVSFVWCTGERRSATLSLERARVDLEAATAVILAECRKGADCDRVYQLSPLCVEAFRAIWLPERAMMLPFPYTSDMFYYRFKKLLRRAGIPQDRWHMAHCLRRSFASHLQAAGGNAAEALGHSDPRVTQESYLSPLICGGAPAWQLLPRIDDDGPKAA